MQIRWFLSPPFHDPAGLGTSDFVHLTSVAATFDIPEGFRRFTKAIIMDTTDPITGPFPDNLPAEIWGEQALTLQLGSVLTWFSGDSGTSSIDLEATRQPRIRAIPPNLPGDCQRSLRPDFRVAGE